MDGFVTPYGGRPGVIGNYNNGAYAMQTYPSNASAGSDMSGTNSNMYNSLQLNSGVTLPSARGSLQVRNEQGKPNMGCLAASVVMSRTVLDVCRIEDSWVYELLVLCLLGADRVSRLLPKSRTPIVAVGGVPQRRSLLANSLTARPHSCASTTAES